MTKFCSPVTSTLFAALVMSGLVACGGGGGGDAGSTGNSGGGFTASNPNTKPQISSSISSTSSLAASSIAPLSSTSSSSRRSAAGADLIPPTAPENFEVGLKIYDAIGLNWTFSTDNIAVVSYKIYRDNVQIGDAAEVDSAFLDFDVAPNKSYNYSISAVDAVGNASPLKSVTVRTPAAPIYTGSSSSNSSFSTSTATSSVSSVSANPNQSSSISTSSKSSAQSSVTSGQTSSKSSTNSSVAPPDITPPEAPKSLTTTAIHATKVDLEWSAATDNQAVAAYRIYRDGIQQTTVKASILSFSDTEVTQSKTYTYAIETVDAAGNPSLTRKTLSVTTPPATSNGDVTLYWSAPTQREDQSSLSNAELGGYLIRYKPTISTEFLSIHIPNGGATSYIIPSLVGDYEFEIAVYDKDNLYSKFVSLSPH